ncbi:MAG: PIN domain-containing protein [Terriglobia bacterium]
MVLVDTSVWIEYLDRGSPQVEKDVEELLHMDEAAVAGIVMAEIRRGCRKANQVRNLMNVFEPLVYFETDREAWLRAGQLAADGAARGAALQLADCLLAALAFREDCSIYTLDRDFDRIPALKLYRPHVVE